MWANLGAVQPLLPERVHEGCDEQNARDREQLAQGQPLGRPWVQRKEFGHPGSRYAATLHVHWYRNRSFMAKRRPSTLDSAGNSD